MHLSPSIEEIGMGEVETYVMETDCYHVLTENSSVLMVIWQRLQSKPQFLIWDKNS